MTPNDLEARLGGQPDSATVAAVIHELRGDPDWTLSEVMLDGQIVAVEMVHYPSGTVLTLSRQSDRPLRQARSERHGKEGRDRDECPTPPAPDGA